MAVPAKVHAFSDAERFAQSAAQGGGGGRWFTGSPIDGYSCAVCHVDGTPATAAIEGVPRAGFVPGQTYDLRVDWADDGFSRSLVLDMVDARGVTAGVLGLTDEAAAGDAERCGMQAGAARASYLVEASPGRAVVGVTDCSAGELRFTWTAPVDAVGPVVFAGAVVRSNKDGNLTGDSLYEFAEELYPVGQAPSAGCRASTAQPRALWSWIACVALLVLARRRARARV